MTRAAGAARTRTAQARADARGADLAALAGERQRRRGGAPAQSAIRGDLALHPALRHRHQPLSQRGASDLAAAQICPQAKPAWSSARDGPGRSGTAIRGCTRTRSRSIEGEPAAGRRRVADRSRRALHRQGLLQRALADSGAAVHARRRGDRRRLPAQADRTGARDAGTPRACRPRRPTPIAWSTARATICPGLVVDIYADAAVGPDHDAGDVDAARRDLRRARGGAGREDDLRARARLLRGAGGLRRRLARRARRLARDACRWSRTASRWRSSRSAGRRPACSSISARRARASLRWRAARACSTSTPTRAASGSRRRARAPTAVTAVDSSARAVARITAHAAANGVADRRRSRPTRSATSRRRRRASFDLVVIDPPKFARARKDLEAARKGYERLNALALQAVAAGRHPGDLLLLAERRRRDLRAHRRRRRQAGGPRGPRVRAPRPRRRSPAAARRSPRAST